MQTASKGHSSQRQVKKKVSAVLQSILWTVTETQWSTVLMVAMVLGASGPQVITVGDAFVMALGAESIRTTQTLHSMDKMIQKKATQNTILILTNHSQLLLNSFKSQRISMILLTHSQKECMKSTDITSKTERNLGPERSIMEFVLLTRNFLGSMLNGIS